MLIGFMGRSTRYFEKQVYIEGGSHLPKRLNARGQRVRKDIEDAEEIDNDERN